MTSTSARAARAAPPSWRNWARRLGFGVTIVDQVTDEGDRHSPFSSSSIRQALRHGHVQAAARELGYHWSVLGEVVRGDQRGRTIGFPTLNIVLEKGADPFRGIYAVRVRDAAKQGRRRSGPGPAISVTGRPSTPGAPSSKSISSASTAISMGGRCWWSSST